LIRVANWINEEDGHLVIRDPDSGNIIHNAQKIIYPGSNGDPRWDCDQLLAQVQEAIDIFNTAHPDCQALFIFDQSSTHGSLPPNALRAFEMNKLDGGKQRKQWDTVIPQSNPFPDIHGHVQKMTMDSGQPKGMKAVLED
jgi:hypothetical protein